MSQKISQQFSVDVKARGAVMVDPDLHLSGRRVIPHAVSTEKGIQAEIIRPDSRFAGEENVHVGKVILSNRWDQDVKDAICTARYDCRIDKKDRDNAPALERIKVENYFQAEKTEVAEPKLKVVGD